MLSWSFEPASADCNGWLVTGADALRASPPRTGAYSCKVCSNGSAGDLALMRDLGDVPAGRYVLTAWVRKRVQNAAPPEAVARLDATVAGSSASATARAVAVRDEWDQVEVKLELPRAASNLRVTIGAASDRPARCLFVDDVLLVREGQ